MFEGIDDSSDDEGGIGAEEVGGKEKNEEKDEKGREKEGSIVV